MRDQETEWNVNSGSCPTRDIESQVSGRTDSTEVSGENVPAGAVYLFVISCISESALSCGRYVGMRLPPISYLTHQ